MFPPEDLLAEQIRAVAVDGMLSAMAGGSHFPPAEFVPQPPRATAWIWRDHLLWTVNTPSLIYESILGYFFDFKCLLADKPLGKLSHFPLRKFLPQQSKTKDKRDSLKQRKSFFVWKAKLPQRVQRSPFLPLEEYGLLWSIKGAPKPSFSMLPLTSLQTSLPFALAAK